MPQSIKANQREKIRLQVRHQRNQLSESFQRDAGEQLVTQLSMLNEVQQVKKVALYLTNDGELNTTPFIHWCWQNNITVTLPVLHPFKRGHLLFLRYQQDSIMTKNRYGIKEPILDVTQVVPANQLDIIFTPLVAFDATGQRLGMGGGFYDRTLAGLAGLCTASSTQQPNVIGLAHDCQQVVQVPTEPWDIPIPMIVTPSQIIRP